MHNSFYALIKETVFARLVAAVQALSEEELDDPARFEWTDGRALWWRVGMTAYYHVLDHVSDLYLERGEADLAQAVQERMAEEMGTLDDSDRWRGTVTYNLACFYALNGQTGPALERLRRAFRLNPGLIDWSKEDSDLDSLRELPEFHILYENSD